MENATKALLIAAAVLVAIIIISITLVIVRQGQEAVAGANMTEAEVAQFNSKFNTYAGKRVTTSQANAILNTVFMHNKQEKASGSERYVNVYVYSTSTSIIYNMDKSIISNTNDAVPKLSGTNYYQVTCEYEGTIINKIRVKPTT